MSVLIKGMEMPEHCGVCRFAVDGWCYAYGKPNIDALANDGRTNFCPLVPVPPHGSLIDEENICGKLRPLIENPYCYNRLQIISETLAHCLRIISDTPTIIPAEEGE